MLSAFLPLVLLGLLVVVDLPICPTRFLFGVPCPGCGLTRATRSLAGGDLQAAHLYHPLVLVILPLVVYTLGRMTLVSAGLVSREARDPLSRAPRAVWWALLAALVGAWLVRLAGGLGGHPDGVHLADGALVRGVTALVALFGG